VVTAQAAPDGDGFFVLRKYLKRTKRNKQGRLDEPIYRVHPYITEHIYLNVLFMA